MERKTKTKTVKKAPAKKPVAKKTPITKKKATASDFDAVMQMAKEWGVGDNPLLKAQVDSFQMQIEMLNLMKATVKKSEIYTTKDYGHGDNKYLDPILKEMPRFTDQLNKTVAGMIDTITRLGTKPEVESVDDLQSFLAK